MVVDACKPEVCFHLTGRLPWLWHSPRRDGISWTLAMSKAISGSEVAQVTHDGLLKKIRDSYEAAIHLADIFNTGDLIAP